MTWLYVDETGRTTTFTPGSRRPALPSLTSLRFFAALLVVAVHIGSLAPKANASLLGGGVGVSFFYLLSGFILTWAWTPDLSVKRFYRRRIARIGPMHWLTWTVRLALTPLLGAQNIIGVFLAFFLLQAWLPTGSIAFAGNGVSWSLSVEAFFYALFPFIVTRATRLESRRLWQVMALAAACSVIIAVLSPTDGIAYIFPPARLPEFVIGCCLGVVFTRGWRPRVGFWPAAALAAAATAVAFIPAFPLRYDPLVTLVPYGLLIASAASADLAGTVPLRARWMILLGESSFSLFMTHQLVVFSIATLVTDATLRLLLIVPTVVCCVLLSIVCFTFVERPMEKRFRGV